MENFELFKQGAEARLYKGIYLGKSTIAKERFAKKYRHKNLNLLLTKERMKSESRAIVRCKMAAIRTPAIYLIDFNRNIIFMEYLEHNITAKEFIEAMSSSIEVLRQFAVELGQIVGRMHESNIIHGDLTSSNILLVHKRDLDTFTVLSDLDVVLIDFGLAHTDSSTEDKGVDLYVLERALISTHSVAEELFPKILEGYQQGYRKGSKDVLIKFNEVRARGRKRTMVG